MKISVVIPVYGCPEAVVPLCERIRNSVLEITPEYEIILVNDACPLDSWTEIRKACRKDPNVIGIDLSRNFGQMRATIAGLDRCSGDWVIVMDCDGQDRPEGIPELYRKAQEGYDVVFARRKDRKDRASVKLLSKMFYGLYNYFTDGHFDNAVNNFSISRRQVVQEYCRLREQNRDYPMFLQWLGFRYTSIDVEAEERLARESSYSFRKKMSVAAQLISAQSNKPLELAIKLGFLISGLSFVFIVWKVIAYFTTGDVPDGWTSVIVSIFMMGGIILMFLGMLGVYIGYIFNEVKRRPLYVIRTVLTGEQETFPEKERDGHAAG